MGCLIEEHYSLRAGQPRPMDIEWAKDGRTGELWILQARPRDRADPQGDTGYLSDPRPGKRLLTGKSIGEKIGVGPVRVVKDLQALQTFRPGEVLVADMTDPDWEPTMKMASAIVTNRGGRTCHAAIVSRELGVLRGRHGAGLHRGPTKMAKWSRSPALKGKKGVVYGERCPTPTKRSMWRVSPPTAHEGDAERGQSGASFLAVISAQ